MSYRLIESYRDQSSEVYNMLQTIPANENGFENTYYGITYDDFVEKTKRDEDTAKGKNLPEGYVPGTKYFFYVDNEPVGLIKLRHKLNKKLLEDGGNIGYGIAPAHRGKGYASIMLGLVLKKAKDLGLNKVLITADYFNHASARVAEKNGGVLEKEENGLKFYWIEV